MDVDMDLDKQLDKAADFITKHLWNRVLEKRYMEYQARKEKERQESVDKILKQAIDATEGKGSSLSAITSTSSMLSKAYTSYSGVDTRVYFTDEPWGVARLRANSEGRQLQDYKMCQSISWTIVSRPTVLPDGEVTWHKEAFGTMTDVALDYMPIPPEGCYITVMAANEYGKACVVFEGRNFTVNETSSGVSIDSLVIEQTHKFTCDYLGAYPLGMWDSEKLIYSMDRLELHPPVLLRSYTDRYGNLVKEFLEGEKAKESDSNMYGGLSRVDSPHTDQE